MLAAACGECREPIKSAGFQEINQLILHTSAELICGKGKDWKPKRDSFLRDLKKRISALRNSGGGIVFVHITHLSPEDRWLDYFHELVDDRLNGMIEDGSLFVSVYKKDWLSDVGDNEGIVHVTVLPSASVVTLDFKTKVPLDNCVVDPSNAAIVNLLTKGINVEAKAAKIRGLDYIKLRESRHVQVKGLNNKTAVKELLEDIDAFVEYVWEGLRLRDYITAFSKVDGGGSIYFGVQEVGVKYQNYTTKKLEKTGFHFKLCKWECIRKLKSKVIRETIVLMKDGTCVKFTEIDDSIKIAFHPVSEGEDLYVLEVAVAAVDGLVFYDKEGPEAYQIDGSGNIKRMKLEKWHKSQMKTARLH